MDNIKSCKIGEILKPYFGETNAGIHSYRIFNIAIMDVIASIIGAIIISFTFNIKLYHSIIGVFLMGIILHRIFCVPTTIDKLLFRKN